MCGVYSIFAVRGRQYRIEPVINMVSVAAQALWEQKHFLYTSLIVIYMWPYNGSLEERAWDGYGYEYTNIYIMKCSQFLCFVLSWLFMIVFLEDSSDALAHIPQDIIYAT